MLYLKNSRRRHTLHNIANRRLTPRAKDGAVYVCDLGRCDLVATLGTSLGEGKGGRVWSAVGASHALEFTWKGEDRANKVGVGCPG